MVTAIQSVFSTGHIDTYKGDRAVTHGWAIIRLDDNTVAASGHSVGRENAAKTAESWLRRVSVLPSGHPLFFCEGQYRWDTAKVRRQKRAHNAARLAEVCKRVRIEIVETAA
jgi:hypothetical protein